MGGQRHGTGLEETKGREGKAFDHLSLSFPSFLPSSRRYLVSIGMRRGERVGIGMDLIGDVLEESIINHHLGI
jgi:hypothetical protein